MIALLTADDMMHSTCRVLVLVIATVSVVLARVSVRPPTFVAVPGGTATFHCFSSNLYSSDGINSNQWLLNDTLLEDLQLGNVMTETELSDSGTGTIILTNVPESLNRTRISCRIDHESLLLADQVPENTSWLLIQGNLTVDSLNITASNTTIFLTWIAPFTLITNLEPTYCVDVVNSTSSLTLHSECGITETQFSYPIPPDDHCHVYIFTLLPNALVGYGQTTTFHYLSTERAPVIESLNISTHAILIMSAPVCTAELTLVDLDSDSTIILRDDDVTILENTLTFSVTLLTVHRHYNLTVVSSNAVGTAESHTLLVHRLQLFRDSHRIPAFITDHGLSIECHEVAQTAVITNHSAVILTSGSSSVSNADFHAISTTEISDSEDMLIVISIGYSTHSLAQARGALLVFVPSPSDDTVDFTGTFILTVEKNFSHNYTLPFSLPSGRFLVFVYNIEWDGTLSSGLNYPAVRLNFITIGTNPGVNLEASYLLNICHTNSSFHIIWVECAYPSNSEVAGYQVLVQISNSNQVHKLLSSKVISPQTMAAIPVEEEGLYLVTIIGIRRGTGVVGASVEYREIIIVKDTRSDQESGKCSAPSRGALFGIGSGYGILALLIFILLVANVVQWKLNRTHRLKESKTKTDLPKEDHQLYAEIRDPSPSSSHTQIHASIVPSSAPTPPQYEDVTLNVPKSGGTTYQFTQCDAYGL